MTSHISNNDLLDMWASPVTRCQTVQHGPPQIFASQAVTQLVAGKAKQARPITHLWQDLGRGVLIGALGAVEVIHRRLD